MKRLLPKWTVLYNIVSKESDNWVGTGWEFFDDEKHAKDCYDRHIELGNCPTLRPFYFGVDLQHLGIVHQNNIKDTIKAADTICRDK